MDATDGDEVAHDLVLKDVPSRDLSAGSSTRAPARSDDSAAKMGGKVVVPKSGTSLVADEHSTAVGQTSNPTTTCKADDSEWKYIEEDEEFQGLLAAPGVVEVAIDQAPGVVEVAIDQAPGVVEVAIDQAPGVVEVAIDQAPGVVEVAIDQAPGVQLPNVQGQEDDGWTVVRSRRYGMIRGLFPDPVIPAPEDNVCGEVAWVPPVGGFRSRRKHAQIRKGGYLMTDEGLAAIVYGTYGSNGLEF